MKYHGIDAQFANLVKARFPFVYIPTWEEDRALQMIYDVAENKKRMKRSIPPRPLILQRKQKKI